MASADAFPTSISSLYLPTALTSLSHTLASIHQATHSTLNRLASIKHDSIFVETIGSRLNLPLVANERCGSWYIPPARKASSAYFKSTDGHYGEWLFSKRRLNLQVLKVVGEHNGCIIVDSTRRGKSMPDALAKTVPIWCAVLNKLLFADLPAVQDLHTPIDLVGASEHAQIKAKMEGFLCDAKALQLNLPSLRGLVSKPLRPFWITPTSDLSSLPAWNSDLDFHPVVCCTASRRVLGSDAADNSYVQGAGDDSESWAHGLTPPIFWRHQQLLLRTAEEELPDLINDLMMTDLHNSTRNENMTPISPLNTIYLASLPAATHANGFDAAILCTTTTPPALVENPELSEPPSNHLHLHCSPGKLGSRALRTELARLTPFLATRLPLARRSPPRILFACATGRDLAVGVALVVLCLFFTDDHTFQPPSPSPSGSSNSTSNIGISTSTSSAAASVDPPITKSLIRQRLAWITSAVPDANPSRSTLQAVNSFLIARPGG